MGLFIHFTAQLNRIEPADWEIAYQDSLVLLRRFPATLIRADSQQIGKHRRYFFTDKIVRNSGDENECWSICGDRDSGCDAENFSLHRHLRRQIADGSFKAPEVDVLWAEELEISYGAGVGVEIFGNKTQGCPYHLALLAVAALFEYRFPGRCFVFGDIDIESAQQAVRWANAVLSTEIGLPVCCDGPVLYQRVAALYDDHNLAIERFETLFRGSEEETLQVLLAHVEPCKLSHYLAVKLNDYKSLSQLGATRILSSYLSATQNLEALINLVQVANRSRTQSEFSPKALLKVLCQGFVTLDFEERTPLFALARPVDHLATIEDTFSQVFMTLAGAPRDIGFHMNRNALLEVFAAHAPDQREQFQEIIATEEEHCRMSLAKIVEVAGKKRSAGEPLPALVNKDAGTKVVHVLEKEKGATRHPDADLPGVGYILRQIEGQREEFPIVEYVIEMIGQKLDKIVQKNQNIFDSADRQHYLNLIGWAGEKQGIRLWYEAWKDIDEEMDLEVLKHLTALFLISEREINFWNLRNYILEHKSVWPWLVTQPKITASINPRGN